MSEAVTMYDRHQTTPFHPCSLAFHEGYLAGIEANVKVRSPWPEAGVSADFGAGYRCGWHSAHNLNLGIAPQRLRKELAHAG
jgi:hypothetical protein